MNPDPKKKYVINVDMAWSKLHLNPYHFNDVWCNLDQEHDRSPGDKIYIDGAEAEEYLNGTKQLGSIDGNKPGELSRCVNCSQRCRQSKHWDISK
ncbi:MAG: hypothetical protein ACQCN5_03940 [Candidatus Bathyarchaeia archaeon]